MKIEVKLSSDSLQMWFCWFKLTLEPGEQETLDEGKRWNETFVIERRSVNGEKTEDALSIETALRLGTLPGPGNPFANQAEAAAFAEDLKQATLEWTGKLGLSERALLERNVAKASIMNDKARQEFKDRRARRFIMADEAATRAFALEHGIDPGPYGALGLVQWRRKDHGFIPLLSGSIQCSAKCPKQWELEEILRNSPPFAIQAMAAEAALKLVKQQWGYFADTYIEEGHFLGLDLANLNPSARRGCSTCGTQYTIEASPWKVNSKGAAFCVLVRPVGWLPVFEPKPPVVGIKFASSTAQEAKDVRLEKVFAAVVIILLFAAVIGLFWLLRFKH